MDVRQKELSDLQSYIGKIDTEVTMILQHIQWDRSNLLQEQPLLNCEYNSGHRIQMNRKHAHKEQCFLKTNGYYMDDKFLSDPCEVNNGTLIKFGPNEIKHIIDTAAEADPSFKRGTGNECVEPLTLGRLQAAYSVDERRALYDAVVKAAPACHDLADLALLSGNGEEQKNQRQKTRMEILAELRDMKRRRTKYRVAAKTRNYSDLLRDVIKTQMEMYTDVQEPEKKIHISDSKSGDNDIPQHDRSCRDEYINTGNELKRNIESNSTHKREKAKDKSIRHYSDKDKIKHFEDKRHRRNRNEDEEYSNKNTHQDGKRHRLNIKEEKYEKYEDKYSRKDSSKIRRSYRSDEHLWKEKNEKSYSRTDVDFLNSEHKRKYGNDKGLRNIDRIHIKQEDNSETATTSKKGNLYDSKYKNVDSFNYNKHHGDDMSRFKDRNSSNKHRHDSTSREVDKKYDRYYDNYSRKDKKSHFGHNK